MYYKKITINTIIMSSLNLLIKDIILDFESKSWNEIKKKLGFTNMNEYILNSYTKFLSIYSDKNKNFHSDKNENNIFHDNKNENLFFRDGKNENDKIIISKIIHNFNNYNIDNLKLLSAQLATCDRKNIYMNINNIKGLWYIPNYLSQNEIKNIKQHINNTNFVPITQSENSRKVAHFGYKYAYNGSGLELTDSIPECFNNLINVERLKKTTCLDIFSESFNQLIINEYKPGQKIAYHTDHIKQFGNIIVCITIGESVPIYFKNDQEIKKVNIEEGSMYIMTGESRYNWKHSLNNNGKKNRYSLTFRIVNK